MKRAVNDPMHPGVASLLTRSGAINFVRKIIAEPAEIVAARGAAYELLRAGLISYEDYTAARRALSRASLKHMLVLMRRAMPFTERLGLVQQMRRAAPLGVSAYRVRMRGIGRA